MSGEADRKFVIFIDSLGPDDVENHTEFIKQHAFDGSMDAGNPYVTPKVLGEIYTGKNPAEHGLPSISRYDQASRTRPAAPALPEIAAESEEYESVCQFGLPFLVPPEVDPEGDYWASSAAMNQQVIVPQEAQPHLFVPGPAGSLDDLDEDAGLLFNHRVDNVRATFAAARSIADQQDFDVMFISCRIPDSYVHYRFNDQEDGSPRTDRQALIRHVIDKEVEDTARLGDVFVFGDHGGRAMDEVFRINRWLAEHDYLDFEIDEEFIQQSIEEGTMEESDGPGTVRRVGMPGVHINEEDSVAVSDDPFSTGLTLLDGADEDNVRQLIEDLESTDQIDWVDITTEKWDGPLIHEAPDLYPRRREGVFVSGNLADEMGGAEITRSGVHHPYGAWGSTADLESEGEIGPQDLFHVILEEFLDLEEPDGSKERSYGGGDVDEQAAKERLEDLGYL